MYKEHQPVISKFARQNPDNFAKVIKFVLCTIRQPLHTAVKQSNSQDDQSNLFGYKAKAWQEVQQNKVKLFNQCEELYRHKQYNFILYTLSEIHGLGLVKAGFVCQLIYGFGGCIDSHNIKLYSISPNELKIGKVKPETKYKKVDKYLKLIEKLGGTEFLWDTWCKWVASNQNKRYNDAYHVSKLHIEGIVQ